LVTPSSNGLNTLVIIQPPTPVVSSATIVDYQLKISGSGIEEIVVTVSAAIRYTIV